MSEIYIVRLKKLRLKTHKKRYTDGISFYLFYTTTLLAQFTYKCYDSIENMIW